MKYFIFIFFIVFTFTGCSQKLDVLPQESNKSTLIQESDVDEFDDEFEDENREVFDPLKGYNRWMTNTNDKIYIHLFNPVSEGYATVVPKTARIGLSNFFHNLKFPIRFSNNLLQLKFDASMKELGRFMINSTVGVLGFVDVAKMEGIEPQEEDFGQTLGHYGVGSGFHVVLPFLGPSNLRDTLGFGVDTWMDPITSGSLEYQAVENTTESLGIATAYYVNKNSLHPGEYENLKKDALDLYLFFRDTYEQQRAKEIEQ
ncbi:VacJ family lipoprotein [bacterium]|nr:VacJ family lipoprotein [bacterium]MBU1957858.1 VacJ family lipoprotein [bacterium]